MLPHLKSMRRIFGIIYGLPWFCAVLYAVAAHPRAAQAPYIAVAVFGGVLLLALTITVAVPYALRGAGDEHAGEWERAGVEALPLAVFSTCLWSVLFLPLDLKLRLLVACAGVVLSTAAVVWLKRRRVRGR